MSKKIFQDIVKSKKAKKFEEYKPKIDHSNDLNEFYESSKFFNIINKKEKNNTSHKTLWFVAFIAVIILFFAISFLFSNASVTINPKIKDFILNKTFVATKDINTKSKLTYELVVLSGEEKREVKGGEEKDYKEYAKGNVLIYNAFNSSSQILSENTRLEGSNGKIYKTKMKVIIPGMSKSGIPGKIGVDIYGEKVGSDYNSVPIDFKILGFKGTSKYEKIYARSIGDISGGLLGKSSQLGDIEKEKIIKELTDSLFTKLFEKAKNQIPKDYILLNDAKFLTINEEKVIPLGTDGTFSVNIKGTFNGILFNKEKLTKEILSEVLAENVKTTNGISTNTDTDTVDGDIYVSDIENLSISSFDKNLITLDQINDISFNLSGKLKVIWKINEDKLISDLLGKNKKDFSKVLLEYPNIESANLIIKPIWENSFPSKNNKIKININYPK